MGALVTLAGGEGRGRGGHRVPVGAIGGQSGWICRKGAQILRRCAPYLAFIVTLFCQQCPPFLLISIGDRRFGHVTIFDNFFIRRFAGFIAIWCLSCLGNNSFVLTLVSPFAAANHLGTREP